MPLIDSWICALILAVTRRACWVTERAIRRKLSARAIASGDIATMTSVSSGLMRNNQNISATTSTIWPSRLVTRLTTSEKSCVSDVTRETIFPDGCSSKNEWSCAATAANVSSRSFRTTSPITCAASFWLMKLATHAVTPSSSTPAEKNRMAARVVLAESASTAREISTGPALPAIEFPAMVSAISAIRRRCGRK